jgi:hypothetical protein
MGAVIIGGGGREAHCNDGPRHHVVANTMADNILHGLAITDYSSDVFARFNTIEGAAVGAVIDAGSSRVELHRNAFRRCSGGPILIAGAAYGTGPVSLLENAFDEQPGYDSEAGIDVQIEGSVFE